MNPQELMKPRYKVIADYPQSGFKVGDIWPNVAPDWTTDEQKDFTLTEMARYPHLFKPLQWWEERKESEMPEYVKCIKTPDQVIMPGDVLKVIEWFAKDCARYEPRPFRIAVMGTGCFLPVTETEYTEYLKQKL